MPELGRRTEGFGHRLVRPRVADDAGGVSLECHGFPQMPYPFENPGGQTFPVQLGCEPLVCARQAHQILIDQAPQGRHPLGLDGMCLVEARPPGTQHLGPLLHRGHGTAAAEERREHRMHLGLRDARLGCHANRLGRHAHIETRLGQSSDDFLIRVG